MMGWLQRFYKVVLRVATSVSWICSVFMARSCCQWYLSQVGKKKQNRFSWIEAVHLSILHPLSPCILRPLCPPPSSFLLIESAGTPGYWARRPEFWRWARPPMPVLRFWLLWRQAVAEQLLKAALRKFWTPRVEGFHLDCRSRILLKKKKTGGKQKKKTRIWCSARRLLSFGVSTLLLSASLSSVIPGSFSFQPLFKTSRSTIQSFACGIIWNQSPAIH